MGISGGTGGDSGVERLRNGGGRVLVFWMCSGDENARDWMAGTGLVSGEEEGKMLLVLEEEEGVFAGEFSLNFLALSLG